MGNEISTINGVGNRIPMIDIFFIEFYNILEQTTFTLDQISNFTPEDKFSYILSKYTQEQKLYDYKNDTLLYKLFFVTNDICEYVVNYINNTPEPIKTSYFNFYKLHFPSTVSDIFCGSVREFFHKIVMYDYFKFYYYYELKQQQEQQEQQLKQEQEQQQQLQLQQQQQQLQLQQQQIQQLQQQLQQPNYEYYDEYDDDYQTGEITGKSIGGGNNLLIYILVIIILLLLLYFFFIKK
jgi:hypothetical protein